MAVKDLRNVIETLEDIAADLQTFDFDVPVKPADDAPADAWREYGLEASDKLAEAEKLAGKIRDRIEG